MNAKQTTVSFDRPGKEELNSWCWVLIYCKCRSLCHPAFVSVDAPVHRMDRIKFRFKHYLCFVVHTYTWNDFFTTSERDEVEKLVSFWSSRWCLWGLQARPWLERSDPVLWKGRNVNTPIETKTRSGNRLVRCRFPWWLFVGQSHTCWLDDNAPIGFCRWFSRGLKSESVQKHALRLW